MLSGEYIIPPNAVNMVTYLAGQGLTQAVCAVISECFLGRVHVSRKLGLRKGSYYYTDMVCDI